MSSGPEEPALATVPVPGPGGPPPTSSDWSRVSEPGLAPTSTFGTGWLIGRSFSTWWRSALPFALLGGLGSVPMAWVMYRFYSVMPGLTDPRHAAEISYGFARFMGTFALGFILSMVLMTLVMAAVVEGASQVLRGEKVRLGAALAVAVRRGPSVLGVFFLFGLAMLITGCTVVVPFFLLVAWAAAIPAAVVERAGPIRALRRSWGLTRGYRWRVFAGFAVIFIAQLMAGGLLQGISMLAVTAAAGPSALQPGQAMALPMGLYQLFSGMIGTVATVGTAAAHHGLRLAKEGSDPVALAQVFE